MFGKIRKALRLSAPNRTAIRSRASKRTILHLETLEARTLPSTWTALSNSGGGGAMMLLSDGTVLLQGGGGTTPWRRLTPDATGTYRNGHTPSLQAPTHRGATLLSNVVSSR